MREAKTMTDQKPATKVTPRLNWDIGTAYDLFDSLEVLHNPEQYGLRASWAAGVRSRLPGVERKLLEEMQSFLWVPIQWIYNLPAPKDAATALWTLRQVPPAERLMALCSTCEMPGLTETFKAVAERRSWDKNDAEERGRRHGPKPSLSK